ncbi:MAG: hypothetical protein EOO75_20715, partial [Myxococcales bacterium]
MSVMPLRFAVVGHPVAHSVSPAMQMAALRALGLPHLYEAIDCPARASFDRVLMLLRRGYFAGLNVTAPYKGPAFESAGVFDDDARRAVDGLVEVGQAESAQRRHLHGGR